MARGLWICAISFGLVNVPVELFSAVQRTSELDLTMLDKRDAAQQQGDGTPPSGGDFPR